VKFPRPHLNSLVLCVSGLLAFCVAAGFYGAFRSSIDLVNIYAGARCMFHGCNPYDTTQLEQQYLQAGGRADELAPWEDEVPMYPPSSFLALFPLTLLRFPEARVLWFLLNGFLFVTSAGMILSMCPRSYRWLSTILISLLVVSIGLPLALGNPAIFAISLLIIGSYLFFRGRFLPLGAFLLMLSLAAKPQIGGLIVVYLLVRGIHRRYAEVAMAGALALLLTAGLILSLHPRSTDWISTLSSDISASMEPGGINDPEPANIHAITLINLQAIASVFFPDAREYNAVAYAVFLTLLAVLIAAVLRTNACQEITFLSIGALSVLSLMPAYHRIPDARLLLISVPAVAIVYQKRRLLGFLIGALTVLETISIQGRVQVFIENHGMWQSILQSKLLFVLLLRQQNLELLILFCLYMVAIFSIRFPGAPANGGSRKPPAGAELNCIEAA